MEEALIVSFNFNPGHVSHLMASYKQFEDLGYKSIFYLNKKFLSFLPEDLSIYVHRRDKITANNVKVAIFLFPSHYNLTEIIKLKIRFRGLKIIYIFHEPMESLKIYRSAGFTIKMLIKASIIDIVNAFVVALSNIILLPSDKAVKLYDSKKYYLNKNRHYVPLMFDDEKNSDINVGVRKYFSYIGTIASDHSFNEYYNFIEWAILHSKLKYLNFMIATKSNLIIDSRFQTLIDSGRLILFEGKPLTNEQINECYSLSYVVWNAYIRTTQSGVLAKAFMFGTPVIILDKNISELASNGQELIAISNNQSFDEILIAIDYIKLNFSHFSYNSRQKFITKFYYKNYNSQIDQIIKNTI